MTRFPDTSPHLATAQKGSYETDGKMGDATSRLRQEAQQTPFYGGRSVRDITEDFTSASCQLQSGQLVKDEFFTLFEAVGALEVCLHIDSGALPVYSSEY